GQFAAVDEILTGRENLVLVARLRHLKGGGQIADELLARFQLTDAADRKVSILHGGRIIANGTLAELKQLLPPAKVEYVEKQPTLEDVFLAIVGATGTDDGAAMTAASAP